MDMYDYVIAGFIGGSIGAIAILTVMYTHWKYLLRDYLEARRDFKTIMKVSDHEYQLKEIQAQLKALNAEFYNRSVEE